MHDRLACQSANVEGLISAKGLIKLNIDKIKILKRKGWRKRKLYDLFFLNLKNQSLPNLKTENLKNQSLPNLKTENLKNQNLPNLKTKNLKNQNLPNLKTENLKNSTKPTKCDSAEKGAELSLKYRFLK